MSRLEQLRALLNESPEDVFLHYAMAMELLSIGDLTAAEAGLHAIANKWPDYLAVYYQLGQLALQKEDEDAAKKWFTQGVELARKLNNRKTLNELNAALDELS